MQYIQKESRDQITFLPDCIEDYISEDNPVRVIDAFVDNLWTFPLLVLAILHSAKQAALPMIPLICLSFTFTDI